jgi:hypothetical protein
MLRPVLKREAIYKEVTQKVLVIHLRAVEDIMVAAAEMVMEPLALVQEMDPVAAAPLTSICLISQITRVSMDRVDPRSAYSLAEPRRLIMWLDMVLVAV